jgi:glycosyltransferase involved in cell wall biosynthesis
MHIVQIVPELNQGGVERLVIEYNREFELRGHQSTVISAGGGQSSLIEEEYGRHITLEVCSKNPITFPFRAHALRARLRTLEPDIVHVHSRVPAWLAWFANRKLNLPLITSVHGFNSVNRYSEIMTRGERVICVSHPVKSYVQQHYSVPESRIDVIHPGVNPITFDPTNVDLDWMHSFKRKHRLEGKRIVTTVGRITELKDYETFIRAIASCAKDNSTIRGLIAGGIRHDKQAYYERLQQLVRDLDVEEQVLFIDSPQIVELYALSDLVVSCSKKPESFGLTLIEALAMNTPVIATRHGGPLDVIREGENGFFFEPQHPEELAQLISENAPLSCNDLRTDTLNRFGLSRMIDATVETYQQVL